VLIDNQSTSLKISKTSFPFGKEVFL